MYMRRRRVKFTAMSAVVVLTLTGFSSGCGHASRDDSSSSKGSSGSDAKSSATSTGRGGDTHRSQPTHSVTPTTPPLRQ